MTVSLDELITGALETGKKIGMEVKVTLQRQPKSKRVALLVTKEPHCLEKLLGMAGTPEFNGQIVGFCRIIRRWRRWQRRQGSRWSTCPRTTRRRTWRGCWGGCGN